MKKRAARRKMLEKRIRAMPYSDVEAIRRLPFPPSDGKEVEEVREVLRREKLAKLH